MFLQLFPAPLPAAHPGRGGRHCLLHMLRLFPRSQPRESRAGENARGKGLFPCSAPPRLLPLCRRAQSRRRLASHPARPSRRPSAAPQNRHRRALDQRPQAPAFAAPIKAAWRLRRLLRPHARQSRASSESRFRAGRDTRSASTLDRQQPLPGGRGGGGGRACPPIPRREALEPPPAQRSKSSTRPTRHAPAVTQPMGSNRHPTRARTCRRLNGRQPHRAGRSAQI